VEGVNRNSVVFSLNNQVGGLARALHVFEDLGVNVVHIESRAKENKSSSDEKYEILVDVECDDRRMEQLVSMLRREVTSINLSRPTDPEHDLPPQTPLSMSASFGLSNSLENF
jgi:tryptophan 5-monooxygenase